MPEAIPEKCLSKPWFESMDLLNGEPAPGPWKKLWGNMAEIILLTVKIICQWIGLREKLQENRIFHGKIDGFRLRFSHHPILWLKGKHYRIYLQKSVSLYSDI